MKALSDPDRLLADGLAAIRAQFRVPTSFPPAVAAAAEAAARRVPGEHADWTQVPFVTLDPASSTDLDQAFAIEAAGTDLLLHYAIADVAWFVGDGDPLDGEAWSRGTTLYLPDGKAPLYPPVLSQGAASLLPDGPRPAVVFTVRVAPDGGVALAGVERAVIRSRAKLAYETVRDDQLPSDFAELAARIETAEARRGAARVDPPEQEVEDDGTGRFVLRFRPRTKAEDRNAALSLATNMAVADALLAAGTGLFRVMPRPTNGLSGACATPLAPSGLTGPRLCHWPSSKSGSTPLCRRKRPSCWRSAAPARARAMSPMRPGSSRGMRRWPRPMPMPPPRCAAWPTAKSSRRRVPGPKGRPCRWR